MTYINNIIKDKIKKESILFFDMDGTLVNTNYANFLSYKEAIWEVTNITIDGCYTPKERFNRETLKKVVPNISKVDFEKIIQLKNKLFKEHLPETRINNTIVEVLKKYSKTHKTVLVTKSRKERALLTLKYHGLIKYFTHKFYKQINSFKENKFTNAISSLQISPNFGIVFENDLIEIEYATNAGILTHNIIKI